MKWARSNFLRIFIFAAAAFSAFGAEPARITRPNILIAIADDQSFGDTSFAGAKFVRTPAFDRVAREGVYFTRAFAASPGCSPSRAALLTGRLPWQIEQAGTHDSGFPAKYTVFPDLLEQAGYFVGMTGKGWGPGNWKASGRIRNPAGPEFAQRKVKPPYTGIEANDYAANFADFLAARPSDRPFFFWYGGHEPHRPYEKNAGLREGKKLGDVIVPAYLPDATEVRNDLLDYGVEIEWFDRHLGLMIQQLEARGELENTIIIVTSDNGMPFPRAKANTYEAGIHVPLAIRWGAKVRGARTIDDLVSLADLAPTVLEAAGVHARGEPYPMSAHSIVDILFSERQGQVDPSRNGVYSGRERHSSARYNNWTYPERALRTAQYLYIRNFRPDRWPAGDPVVLDGRGNPLGPHSGYKDIDDGPTLEFLVAHADDPQVEKFLQLSVAKRPAEELFDVVKDPACLSNLCLDPKFEELRKTLAKQLLDYLQETGDPRVLNGGEIWETYPRYSPLRQFPAPSETK